MNHYFIKKSMLLLITCTAIQLYASATRMGLSVFTHNAMGNLEKCIDGSVGFGINTEFSIVRYFGFALQFETSYIFFSSSRVDAIIDLTGVFGIWFRIPLGFCFALQPEVTYGAVIHCLYPSKNARKIKNYYFDQQIRAALGFRITPVNCNFEIDIAPMYTLFLGEDFKKYQLGGRVIFFKYLQ